MTAQTEAPAAHECEASDQLRRAAYALKQMTGSKVIDLGALAGLLEVPECTGH